VKKLGKEGVSLSTKRDMFDKPRVNIILNGGKLKPCLLKSGRRQGCRLSSLSLGTELEFLARAIRQDKEIEGTERKR
jgi:hypothetical protein